MVLRFRKSIKLGKGIRLNIGKKSAGISFGTKGLRYSINSSGRKTSTIGIPGTGISYSKSSSGINQRQYASSAITAKQQLQRQKQLQKLNEIQRNAFMVNEYNQLITMIKGVHKECGEVVDWQHIHSLNPPYNPPDIGTNQARAIREYEQFSPRFYEKLFTSLGEKRKQKLEADIVEAEMRDRREYEEWQSSHLLSGKIIQGDIDAYHQVIDEMNPLDKLLEFGGKFQLRAVDDAVLVEFQVKLEDAVPNYVLSLTKTGKLSRKDMSKTEYYALVQDYVCSCTIKIAREMIALLPVKQVMIHATDHLLNTATGFNEDMTILSVIFDREGLNALNFEHIDPSDALQNFRYNMKFMKTSGLKPVERIRLS